MSELNTLITTIEDDYLIGLSNKGIVKRAYKELEKASVTLRKETEEEIEVTIEDVSCTIRAPLGESSCSCPSRTICKHIITAILYLKQRTPKESTMVHSIDTIHHAILEFPIKKCWKVIGNKELGSFIYHMEHSEKPKISKTSILQITFPWNDITIKFLDPLEYSSCSCHKKELCEHKAEAILYYQLRNDVVHLEEIRAEQASTINFEKETVKTYGISLREVLDTAMVTGITRTSPSIIDSFEHLAVMAHTAKLPEFEKGCRKISKEYEAYFNKNASFRLNRLMQQLCFLRRKLDRLLLAKTEKEVMKLAGEFKMDYLMVGNLQLVGISKNEFNSNSGYEGETFYFLEKRTKEWYTYTKAIPTYYEKNRRNNTIKYSESPWGLECKQSELSKIEFQLQEARATKSHRISASNEIKGKLIGKSNLCKELIETHFYDDFQCLFKERLEQQFSSLLFKDFQENDSVEVLNSLVFVQAKAIGEANFNAIHQTFQMKLYDENNLVLQLEIHYSPKEQNTIRQLERLAKRLEEKKLAIPCFFGKLYLENGEMKLYPIDYFEQKELMK